MWRGMPWKPPSSSARLKSTIPSLVAPTNSGERPDWMAMREGAQNLCAYSRLSTTPAAASASICGVEGVPGSPRTDAGSWKPTSAQPRSSAR